MNFEQWLAENGYDAVALAKPENAKQRKHLEMAWKSDTAAVAVAVPVVNPNPSHPVSVFEEKMKAIEGESQRITYIREATSNAAARYTADPEKIKQLRELCDTAVKDQKMDQRAYDLALLRIDRMMPPMVMAPREQHFNNQFLEAAVALTTRLPNPEKHYSEAVLEAASSKFKRGIGLKELLSIAAERNNQYRGSTRDEHALCRAAFMKNPITEAYGNYGDMRADVGVSTINVTGILSNIANKFLTTAFLFTEQAWRSIAQIRSAADFKQMTTYRLTGANKFEKIPPGGEIKHGTLGELSYTNQIETWGKMLGIDRRDIINDDLGAISGATQDLARGAGDSLNEVFWTEFLDDDAFFPTDKSLGNYDDGSPDSVLSLAGLENADNIFAQQTKPDLTPLGVMPEILLVPRGLRTTAMTLMSATGLTGVSGSLALNQNPWAGMYTVVSSLYLAKAALGGSATAWYLLANPGNIAVIQVAFLNGRETPIVETADFDFDRLGLAMRAYMDFGVAKQEHRAGLKMAGA